MVVDEKKGVNVMSVALGILMWLIQIPVVAGTTRFSLASQSY